MSDDLTLQAQARALAPFLRTLVFSPFYEENTYTPTYVGGTTAGVTTYTTQVGFYRRLGSVVLFNGRLDWTAATGTGVARVSTPFTTDSTTNMRYAVPVWSNGVTFANNNLAGLLAPGVAFFTLDSLATNAAPTSVNVEAAGTLIWAGYLYVTP